MENYNSYVLTQVAEACPEFEPDGDSYLAGIDGLTSGGDIGGERICNECSHWNNGTCDIYQDHKGKYE